MFKKLFAALRRKHGGNVASPKDAGNVSVPEEEFAKEPVVEMQETSVATGISQTEAQSASGTIRPNFKFSSVITPNNSFEAYTLHAFDVNYALYAEASDRPEGFVKDVEDKVHELYEIHCAFDRLFNVMKNPNTQVSIGESDTMLMCVVAALQCRNGKRYAQALDKLKEGVSGEEYFNNSVCSVAVSILCASGDLSDAYLLLQYIVLYCQEKMSAIFFRRYAQLIMSVEELAKTDIEDLVISYMQNSSKKSFFIDNTYVPIINVPIGAGIFRDDIEKIKHSAPGEYASYVSDPNRECNKTRERAFETLLDRLHRGMETEGTWVNTEKEEEAKEEKKRFLFSDAITPENEFEAYTLHAFDVNYAQFASPSDEPEKNVDAIKHQLHELSNIHCLFHEIFDEITKPNVTIIEDALMTKENIMRMKDELSKQMAHAHTCIYKSDYLMWTVKETFMLIKTLVKQRKNISPDACLIIISLLYLVGDLSDACLLLKYLAVYLPQNDFLLQYIQLIVQIEGIAKENFEDFIRTYIGVYIEGIKMKVINIPVKSGVFRDDIEALKHNNPELYKLSVLDPDEECNEGIETVFETLSDRAQRKAEEEKKDVEIKPQTVIPENAVLDENTEKEYELYETSDILTKLNSKDMKSVDEAVKTTEKNVKLIAKNGFEVDIFVQRIKYLINELHAAPEKIACFTATNTDAKEVRDKIQHIPESARIHVCTLKKLGYEIIAEAINILGWSKNFKLINENEQIELIAQVARKVKCSKSNLQMQAEIKKYKTSTEQYISCLQKEKYCEENNESVVETYLALQRDLEVFDFDDLIEIPRQLISNYPSVAEHWKNAYDYCVIDENQETQSEHDLLDILTQDAPNILTICENESQEKNKFSQIIYIKSWSADLIKEAAKRLDKIKQIYGIVPEGAAEVVAKSIHDLWESYYIPGERWLDYNDIAVIYRDEKLIEPFTKVFEERKIPFSKIKHESLLETPEVKLILLLMSVIVRDNLYDYQALIKEFTTNVSENAVTSIIKENKRSESHIIDTIEEKLSVCLTEEEKNFLNEIKKLKEGIDYAKPYAIIEVLISHLNLKKRLCDERDEKEIMGNLSILLEKINEDKTLNSNKERILHFLNDANFTTCSTYSRQKKYYGVHFVHACDVKWMCSMMFSGFKFAYVIGLDESVFSDEFTKPIKEIEQERYLLYTVVENCRKDLYLVQSGI